MPAIVWQVDPQCGTETDIIKGTLEILNSNTTSPFGSTTQKISGEISQTGAKWRVHLIFQDSAGAYERTLTANTCRGAIEAAILLSALAVDSKKVLRSEDPKLHARVDRLSQLSTETDTAEEKQTPQMRAAAKEPPNVAAINAMEAVKTNKTATPDNATGDDAQKSVGMPRTDAAVAPPESVGADMRLSPSQGRGMLGLGATMDMGLLSSFRPGVAVRGTWYRHFWMLAASMHYLPPASSAVAKGAMEARWTSQAIISTLQAGHHYSIGRLGLGWALGVRLVGIRAKTEQIVMPESKGVWVGTAVMGGQFTWLISNRLGLWLAPSAVLLLARPTFLVTGIGVIHQPKRIVAEAVIGFFYTIGNGKARWRPYTR